MKQQKPESHLYSVKEAATYLGLSTRTIYEWIHKRKIDFIKISNRVLIEEATLQKLVEKGRVKARVAV